MRIAALAFVGLFLIACGEGGGDPCPPGQKVADIPAPTASNPSARGVACVPADKLPEGGRWL